MNIESFERNIEATRTALGDGIESISIWSIDTGLVLAEWQGNETAVALLTRLIENLRELMKESLGVSPSAGGYLFVDLKGDKSLVVINHGGGIMQGWLLDTSKVKPGIVLDMALPSTIKNLAPESN